MAARTRKTSKSGGGAARANAAGSPSKNGRAVVAAPGSLDSAVAGLPVLAPSPAPTGKAPKGKVAMGKAARGEAFRGKALKGKAAEGKAPQGKGRKAAKPPKRPKLPAEVYEAELLRLQSELVAMQAWIRREGIRLVVIFEGRDAAGKGGTIKRVTEFLSPRVARIVALPAPTERQRTEWYFQRYIEHLPAGGETVIFDRSWYNRGGVERVMGFATPEQHQRFLRQCPIFERLLVEDGILLRKYWFSVSDAEQLKRFRSRMDDPLRRWKLSPMDMESISRWEEYSRAKDEMFVHTDIPESPWFVVDSDDKKRARLNMIAHLLTTVPYENVAPPPLSLPRRPRSRGYERTPRELQRHVPDYTTTLRG